MSDQLTISVAQYRRHAGVAGFDAYLPTAWGEQLVGYFYESGGGPWAHCPRDNGGFGMSYAVDRGTRLVLRPNDDEPDLQPCAGGDACELPGPLPVELLDDATGRCDACALAFVESWWEHAPYHLLADPPEWARRGKHWRARQL